MGFGLLAVPDLVAYGNQNVKDFGEARLFDFIDAYAAAENAILMDAMEPLVEVTTDRIRGYGGSTGAQNVDLDEFGVPDASKASPGAQIGFPLRASGSTLEWTRLYFENVTANELAAHAMDHVRADKHKVVRKLKEAIFGSSNYTSADTRVDGTSLFVKRLANADSTSLPPAPDGSTFNGATHTHYLARAGGSLAASDIQALLDTVSEHFSDGRLMLYINKSNLAAVQAMTSAGQFLAAPAPNIIYQTDENIPRRTIDQRNTYNRYVGYFGATSEAEVWVKAWIPANYMLAVMLGTDRKVLAYRQRNEAAGRFRLLSDDENYPLRAKTWMREFGFGVQERVTAAVLYTADTSYAVPTFT